MPPAGFEPAIPASERPQTDTLGRAATGIGPGYRPNYKMESKKKTKHNVEGGFWKLVQALHCLRISMTIIGLIKSIQGMTRKAVRPGQRNQRRQLLAPLITLHNLYVQG
jgi:hypothetical protein